VWIFFARQVGDAMALPHIDGRGFAYRDRINGIQDGEDQGVRLYFMKTKGSGLYFIAMSRYAARMARPLRLEFAGALYHVTSRGNARQRIFLDEEDRRLYLELLGKEVAQQGWRCYAYCLMDNHYHLLIETPEPNLVAGMRRLNGVYTQAFNRRHRRVGHLFQGRYKAIVVEKDAYLRELCRYIVLKPVRAKAVKKPGSWRWSSYRLTSGEELVPSWLAATDVRALFPGRGAYRRFVEEGIGQQSPWLELRGQIYLGGEEFLKRVEGRLPGRRTTGIARSYLKPLRPTAPDIEAAVAKAYRVPKDRVLDRRSGECYKAAVYLLRRAANLPLVEVAKRAEISSPRVSQIQAEIETGKLTEPLKSLIAGYKVKL
jgi:REP element-mobilizing transposase RayT